jgi:hypothetical protein
MKKNKEGKSKQKGQEYVVVSIIMKGGILGIISGFFFFLCDYKRNKMNHYMVVKKLIWKILVKNKCPI